MTSTDHISVCICTFRRPELLRRLLQRLEGLRTGGRFSYSVVVTDNDATASARPVAEAAIASGRLPLEYVIEPERNIALVRNRAVSRARGEYIAFIDDDEVPDADWLLNLLATRDRFQADGVLGPVRPYFDEPPPAWILRGRLCDRPSHPTGMVMKWQETRTGNVLLRKSIFDHGACLFDPAFRTGGEDVDFFRRAVKSGRRFVWCEEAPVHELVSPERCRTSYFLRRALLQGSISLRYMAERPGVWTRLRILLRSAVAIGFYTLAFPVSWCAGRHLGMRFLIKDCHHVGRVLALAGFDMAKVRNI